MIPLPRNWLLTSAMLVGVAVGLIVGAAGAVLVTTRIRPDVVIGVVVGFPTIIGLLVILVSGRRWLTALGVSILSMAPGWFGVLAVIEVMTRA